MSRSENFLKDALVLSLKRVSFGSRVGLPVRVTRFERRFFVLLKNAVYILMYRIFANFSACVNSLKPGRLVRSKFKVSGFAGGENIKQRTTKRHGLFYDT